VEKNKKYELGRMKMKKTNEQTEIDHVAREILVHALIISAICTLVVVLIP
jgi:hypothetical protein